MNKFIYVDVRSTFIKRMVMILELITLVLLPIFFGRLTGIYLMEWVGLIIGFMLFFALAAKQSQKHTFKTVEDAIKFLQSTNA